MKSPQASGQSWLQMKLDFITQFVIKDLFTFFSPLCFCGVCIILRLAPLMAPRWLSASSPVQQAREHQYSRKSPKTHASNNFRASAHPDWITGAKGRECTYWIAKVSYITSEGKVESTSLESYVPLRRNWCCWKHDGEF